MNLIDLQKSLRAVEPAAVLVPPRVLENIVKQSWNLSGFYWNVPHRSNFIIDRQTLFRHVDQEELALEPNELLPATVMLIAWPSVDDTPANETAALLLKVWQQVFHASVHLLLENQWSEGKLTQADLRARITEIGPAQFEEIKSVLVQDNCLPADAGERLIYMEFAAHFLEEYYFTSGLLDGTFPGLKDKEATRKLLERDVDGAGLFKRTRLAGAMDPVVQTVTTSQEAHEFYYKLVHSSERASLAGNVVLAAIQRQRAARVAPPDLAFITMQQAVADMQNIAGRLKNALELDDVRTKEWHQELLTLLDKADQGSRPAEAAMLYDLQQVCLDNEQDIYAPDLVEWSLSFGRRPMKRPLPSQRLVRLTRHLRSATQRLTMARLSEKDRKNLAELLQNALEFCETRLRQRFRPVFVTSFEDVGLKPRNPPEKVAFNKVIEELLDRIMTFGFLTFSDLRDTLSRNQLKLPDLSDPSDFIFGDQLIRLDRRLATLLDGVYRRSEFYLRWLERVTALNFGTKVGRLLTLWVTLPFGLAFLLIEAGNIVTDLLSKLIAGEEIVLLKTGTTIYFVIVAMLGIYLAALLHSARVRHKTWECTSATLEWLRFQLVHRPMSLLTSTTLNSASKSWSFQLFYWYAFKPLVLFLLISFVVLMFINPTHPDNAAMTWWGWAIVFLASNFLVNSRPGQAMTNAMSYSTVQILEQIRAGLLPRLFNFVVAIFKNSVHFVEAMLFHVDEWLRIRKGDSQLSMAVRAVLTVIWFPISYLMRFNLVVFIEPLLNPLKLPVCSIAFKFWLPIYVIIQNRIQDFNLIPWAILTWVNFWIADAFGFIFWEVKENWRLYRSNRSPTLGPVSIGPHGETLSGLLQPGFHSGTVPRLFVRLRQAERLAYATGNWSAVRACQADLAKVAEAVRLFLVRDFVALLDQEPHWRKQGSHDHLVRIGISPYAQEQEMRVGKVHLATNQVRVELIHPQYEESPVQLEFTSRAGWLVADFGNVGWLKRLGEKELRPLHNALITLYKLAGVDLVREQLQAVLPAEAAAADLSSQGIFVRQEGKASPAVIYDLITPAETIAPQLLDGLPAQNWPTLSKLQVFKNVPITWDECIRSWQPEGPGRMEIPLLAADVELMPPGVMPEKKADWHPPGLNGTNGNGALEVGPESNGEAKKVVPLPTSPDPEP